MPGKAASRSLVTSWLGMVASRLFSWQVAAPASLLLLTVFLGCMSLEIGSGHNSIEQSCTDGVVKQTGTVTLAGHQPQIVYYPIPYISIPNLTLHEDCGFGAWELLEQQWDHFTVRRSPNNFGSPVEVKWTARGLKGPPPPTPVLVAPAVKNAPVSQDAGPKLPSVPVPIEK